MRQFVSTLFSSCKGPPEIQSGFWRLLPVYGTPGLYRVLLFVGKVEKVMGSPSLPTMSLQKLFSHQQPDNQKVHSYSGYIFSFKLLDNKGYNHDIFEAGLSTSPIPLKSKGEFSFDLLQIYFGSVHGT